ncbi:glutathione S-transferase [Ralstonia solanacearum]|uniref:glutathione S-transferase n=1 Tax=Ralstonia solanacearum TaxID=305 RepID=UPI0018D06A95|nr:glutathione S-transferase [Ralstonia solanacearum]
MQTTLYYWPEIQGRGEFVRLALEQAGVRYVDLGREDATAIERFLGDAGIATPPFAPPFLVVDKLVIPQTANILLYLGQHYGLAPQDEAGGLWTHGLQLTLADFVVEIHDTHHPIAAGEYYEDQQDEARRRTADFLANRAPKFLWYFERVLARNPAGPTWAVRDALTYVDLSLFQIVAGLRYAFPRHMQRWEARLPHLVALHARVAALPRIAAYLQSPRRIPFNTMGIFRHYPELDALT